jgi:hypothetical protein
MTEEEVRTAVKEMYPKSKGWHRRVDHMPYSQVLAIHIKNQQTPKKDDKHEADPDIPF